MSDLAGLGTNAVRPAHGVQHCRPVDRECHGQEDRLVDSGRADRIPVGSAGQKAQSQTGSAGLGSIAVLLTALLAAAAPVPAAAQTPQPIRGVYLVSEQSVNNSTSSKRVQALCNPGDRVLGGGAEAVGTSLGTDGVPSLRRLELTRMEPRNPQSGAQRFDVAAAEVPPYTDGTWYVKAQAICAEGPVPGHEIVRTATGWSSDQLVKSVITACPGQKVALGTGAAVNFRNGQPASGVGLLAVKPLGSGRSTRAMAGELPGGHPFEWQLAGYAVCGAIPDLYLVEHDTVMGTGSTTYCLDGPDMLATGASASTTLTRSIIWTPNRNEMFVGAARNPAEDPITAYAICANTAGPSG